MDGLSLVILLFRNMEMKSVTDWIMIVTGILIMFQICLLQIIRKEFVRVVKKHVMDSILMENPITPKSAVIRQKKQAVMAWTTTVMERLMKHHSAVRAISRHAAATEAV